MRLVHPYSLEFSVDVDNLMEIDETDIAAFIDEWLDAFTSDPRSELYRSTQNRVFDELDRDGNLIGFRLMVEDSLWEEWNDGLEEMCIQWLSNPDNVRKLGLQVATEVNLIIAGLSASGNDLEFDLSARLWKKLSFAARQEIGMRVSAMKLSSRERMPFREAMIELHTSLTQDYREKLNESVRSYKWKSVAIVERCSKRVCAQGADLDEATSRLSAFILSRPFPESAHQSRVDEGLYDVFHVPRCMYFDPEDTSLVERWGVYQGAIMSVSGGSPTAPMSAMHNRSHLPASPVHDRIDGDLNEAETVPCRRVLHA